MPATRSIRLFMTCVDAIDRGELISKPSASDKEFAVQNWVSDRLDEAGIEYSSGGRNVYPDFPLAGSPREGIEVKSLAFPGREVNYDANSQPPSGEHHGVTIYYLFARYPAGAGSSYPVHDLVICHGDFLNPDRDYRHRNDNVPNFGRYGDIMIRDRKMYVVRTPYDVAEGLAGHRTLVLPAGYGEIDGLEVVGTVEREEADEIAVGYRFDLERAVLDVLTGPNPDAGKPHTFHAYRVAGSGGPAVALKPRRARARRVA